MSEICASSPHGVESITASKTVEGISSPAKGAYSSKEAVTFRCTARWGFSAALSNLWCRMAPFLVICPPFWLLLLFSRTPWRTASASVWVTSPGSIPPPVTIGAIRSRGFPLWLRSFKACRHLLVLFFVLLGNLLFLGSSWTWRRRRWR